jgi:hypothetical protein
MAAIVTRLEGVREELIEARVAGDRTRDVDCPPEVERSGPEPLVLATAGVAAVAIVVGSVFGARALAMRPGPANATGGGREVSDVRADARAAHRSAIVADLAFLVGIVSGSVAGVLYLGRAESVEPEGSPLALEVPTGAGAARFALDLGIRF